MNATLKATAKEILKGYEKLNIWEASEESDYRRNGNDFEFFDGNNETGITLESADGWKVLCEDFFINVNDEQGARFMELLEGYEDNVEHDDLTLSQMSEAHEDLVAWEEEEGEEMLQDTFNERLQIRKN